MPPLLHTLEPRALFAGDVAAEVVDGRLLLRGDAADNAVFVEQDPSTGVLTVRGDAGTTVNGSAGAFTAAGLTGDVRVWLGEGADQLTVTGANLPGRLVVRAGGGDDAVTLSGSAFAGRVAVSTGRGHDAIRTPSCTFGRALIARGGPGQDVKVVPVRKTFDFRRGRQGWTGGFADYPSGPQLFDEDGNPLMSAEEYYELSSGLRPLPRGLGQGAGFLLSGFNHSDDLFMFLKRGLRSSDGIIPGQAYEVTFDITFASDAPTWCGGVGGAPGESVFLKAGAGATEPLVFLNEVENTYRMNVGHGLHEGSFTSTIGNVANGIPCAEAQAEKYPYVSLVRHHVHNAVVQADSEGRLWLLIGTDSGFEGKTTLYYQRVSVTLSPVAAAP